MLRYRHAYDVTDPLRLFGAPPRSPEQRDAYADAQAVVHAAVELPRTGRTRGGTDRGAGL